MNPNKLTPGYNIMWESSRMMLPEHREQLLAQKRKKKEYTPLPLSSDQLEEMNVLITQSITEDQAIWVTYVSSGMKAQFWGWVKAIHYETRRMKIVNDEDVLNLSLHQIIAIDLN
ncbi:YolD-like family protein [Bacillus altitudinis MN12]|uniref:YolD-like family protein n=1 Tax=Bacillus altitudinis TaxID=293387 RepID=UPI001B844493|nr:YolD-like family protein [Bacillus altitudinis]MBR0582991.1 YolD-like family protein [Bacillus altitudinis MN12]MBR0592833.1 YolD-like family protein [Bacillus altitudinis C16B11]MBR0608661.1 YolD-like family protein [Bacillus altitudinis]